MKNILLIAMIALLTLSLTACSDKQRAEGQSSSTQSSSNSVSSSESSSDLSTSSSSQADENTETATFQLNRDEATRKAIKAGDKLGEWTLSELTIDYDEAKKINMLEANFSGEVTLKGKITRNGLVEEGYDFTVADEDMVKMVQYIPPEVLNDSSLGLKDNTMFMLDIPEGIENSPKLEFNDELPCTITISDYRYIFAYMMAPSGGTVTKIDIENK